MRWVHHLHLLLIAFVGLPAWAANEPIPLSDWVAPTTISAMTISPDGKWVAGIGSTAVFLTEVDTSRSTLIAQWAPDNRFVFGSLPLAVHWIAKDLLAVDFSSRESVSMDLTGKRVARLGERFIRRLSEKGETSDWVLAYSDLESRDIDAVNARTGERREYRISLPGKLIHCAFDESGALLAVTMRDTAFLVGKTRITNWFRKDEQAAWQLLEEFPVTGEPWIPLRVLPGHKSLAVLSRHERDTYGVFRYDIDTRQHVELMAGHPNEDILATSGLDQSGFEYVITLGIKPHVSWFDARWVALQTAVDTALPGRINLLQGDKNGRLLVSSYGDVDPGRWYVLDTKTSNLSQLGAARPRIDPKRMRPMETIRYAARDGMTINAYLTRPETTQDSPAPMVVLIHSGPHVRDHWEWNEEVQLLANQGYAVFQPQFRGSSGFGRRFKEAGYGQWGRAMQDDITDGVRHLIEQKVVDPDRICIYGASYGGYAALWGVVKLPDLYRCGVSLAGISDLGDLLSYSIFDDSSAVSRELDRVRIGNAEQSRQSLDEVSPLKHAADVRVPLLIAHGEEDTRVLPSQSKAMVKALQALGKPVEWMPFEGEGHGLVRLDNRMNYYAALLSFLQRHIGEPRTSNQKAAANVTRP